jgi:hypothetical protein
MSVPIAILLDVALGNQINVRPTLLSIQFHHIVIFCHLVWRLPDSVSDGFGNVDGDTRGTYEEGADANFLASHNVREAEHLMEKD